MALLKKQIQSIEKTISTSLRNKFKNYKPEPGSMPFHTRLLGKDRLALSSFIHSIHTNFGITIFEPLALYLAVDRFKIAKRQIQSGKIISTKAQFEIQKIIDELTSASTKPNKLKEIEKIRKVCQDGDMRKVKSTKVDIYFETYEDEVFLFDIKTAKPNKGGFIEFKRTLLEWTAIILAENPKANVNTLIAIPYNPYEPKPYSRWTMAGMLDLEYELKVAEEFWNFLGGVGTYEELLNCFERVGIEMREEIDEYFSRFK